MHVPGSLLFGLVIAGGTIDMIHMADDIGRNCFNADHTTRRLRIVAQKRELPILRGIDCRNHLSPTRIMTADQLNTHMTKLASRASYQGRLNPYAIRRGHGNILDRMILFTSYK